MVFSAFILILYFFWFPAINWCEISKWSNELKFNIWSKIFNFSVSIWKSITLQKSKIKIPKLPYCIKKEPRAETRGLFNQLWLVIGWSRYNSRIIPGKSQEISHFHFKSPAGFYRKIVSFKINRTLRNWKRPILLSLSSILSLHCCRSMTPTGITGSRSTCMFVFYTGWICPASGAGTLSTWEWSYTWLAFFCISRTF